VRGVFATTSSGRGGGVSASGAPSVACVCVSETTRRCPCPSGGALDVGEILPLLRWRRRGQGEPNARGQGRELRVDSAAEGVAAEVQVRERGGGDDFVHFHVCKGREGKRLITLKRAVF
jgi:hypothetical protein